jgi:hypothetical protein
MGVGPGRTDKPLIRQGVIRMSDRYTRQDAAERIASKAMDLDRMVKQEASYLSVIEQARVLAAMVETFIEAIQEK